MDTQIQVEQPTIENDLPGAPTTLEPNLGDVTSPTDHTSYHNSDHEEQADDPECHDSISNMS